MSDPLQASPDRPAGDPLRRFPRSSPLADRSSRLLAALVDAVFAALAVLPGLILLIIAGVLASSGSHFDRSVSVAGYILAATGGLALAIYQAVLLTRQGQTIGKRMQGIRIVQFEDDANPGFLRAVLLRAGIPLALAAIPYVGLFFVLIDILCILGDERRCLHDMIARTRVVVVIDLTGSEGR
jgi:uncharacterized RDD family membrane protein YckC